MAKAKEQKIFNIKKRWFRRSYIPSAEFYSSVAIVAVAALLGSWFFGQKDNYDHGERDLDPTLLAAETTLELYTRPLKIWQEPGSVVGPSTGPTIFPFPSTTIDPQWQLAGRLRSFEPDNLFEKINGEAEKFLKLNFQQLYYLVLKSTQGRTEIAIELYDHGDVTHSIGIFSGHTSPANEIVNVDKVSYFLTGAGMIGRKGQYFFRVAATDFDEPVKNKVEQLAGAFNHLGLATALPQTAAPAPTAVDEGSDMPLEFRVLNEGLNIPEDTIAFAAQNVFQFDFASNFWFGRLGGDNGEQAFIHIAESPAAAQELYQQLLVEFEFDYQAAAFPAGVAPESVENAVLLKHRFLNTFFAMRIQGQYVLGVENLQNQDAAAQTLLKLSEGINERS